jgi:hypothetical protein
VSRLILAFAVLHAASQSAAATAAAKFFPAITWRPTSVITADFTCRGRKEEAILGATTSEIVVAVFVNGITQAPEVLRYSARARNPRTAKLTIESLDFDPRKEEGYDLPGFRRSRTCKGLNLADGEVDSAHIYWNHDAKRFDDWVR